MKMTKTAAALALAGIAAAPLAQAEVTLTGSVAINLGSSDADGAELTMSGDDSLLNLAASHELNSGLNGYANYRLDSGLTGEKDTIADSVWVGIKGDFGDFRIGEVPNALEYGQVAGDIQYDAAGATNGGMSYTGSFGAATVGLTFAPEGNEDTVQGGVKFSAGGFGVGLGFGDLAGTSKFAVGATYGLGGMTAAVHFIDHDGFESIGAKLSGSAGDIGYGITYSAGQGDGNAQDNSKIRLDASYGLGGDWKVSTRINIADVGNSALDAAGAPTESDVTDYRIQFAKSF